MKAIRMHRRGGPEELVLEDVATPPLADGDALVKVYSAGITPTEFTWNSTFTTLDKQDRLPIIPAFEVSGVVEEVKSDDVGVKAGDEVYGLLDFWRDGAAAEYVSVRAGDLAPKPKSISHMKSSAVPLSGLTAWQALFDYGKLAPGQTVLIHGGGGGVGTYAVQLAKWKGAKVITTASSSKKEYLEGLGADETIDYQATRFEDAAKDVDLVLDTIGGETLERSWDVVKKGGVLVTIAGDAPAEKALARGIRGESILVQPDRQELIQLARLIDGGSVRPVVEGVYALREARAAYERGMLGHNKGKLVLQVVYEPV